MKGYVLTIQANGVAAVGYFQNQTVPLSFLQDAVKGAIEQVPGIERSGNLFAELGIVDQPMVAFCNEEGKLEGLEVNVYATAIWGQQSPDIAGEDVLVGPVVFVTGDEEFMNEL